MSQALWRFSCAILLSILCATSVWAFDIAIYMDPLSWFNTRYLWGKRFHGYTGDYAQFMADTGYTANGAEWMRDVYRWYGDMGVNKVMVNYLYLANFDSIPQDCTHIQVMNWFYPGLSKMYGDKYVDAQFRDVQVDKGK